MMDVCDVGKLRCILESNIVVWIPPQHCRVIRACCQRFCHVADQQVATIDSLRVVMGAFATHPKSLYGPAPVWDCCGYGVEFLHELAERFFSWEPGRPLVLFGNMSGALLYYVQQRDCGELQMMFQQHIVTVEEVDTFIAYCTEERSEEGLDMEFMGLWTTWRWVVRCLLRSYLFTRVYIEDTMGFPSTPSEYSHYSCFMLLWERREVGDT